MATKTASSLVAYAIAQLGFPYWYATYGSIATEALYSYKKKQYPSYYTASDFPKQYGLRVHDCVGIVKGYHWSDTPTAKPIYKANGFPDTSADGMYSYCKKKSTNMSKMPDVPGILVFMSGHVGMYIGNGKVVEARGHAYGVVRTNLKNRPWTKWSYDPDLVYDTETATAPTQDTTTNPYTEPTSLLRKGAKDKAGESAVKWVQWHLSRLKYSLGSEGIDGDFGPKTLAAVLAFQSSAKIEVDGVVGPETRASLKAGG